MFSKLIRNRLISVPVTRCAFSTTRISFNPATATTAPIVHPFEPEVVVDHITLQSAAEVSTTMDTASRQQREWSLLSFEARTKRVRAAVEAVALDTEIPRLQSISMGKPTGQGSAELRGFRARALEQLALAPGCLGIRKVEGRPEFFFPSTLSRTMMSSVGSVEQSNDKVHFDRGVSRYPVGVVLAITPWNYPLLTACQYLIPGLLAGNAVVLSPSLIVARAMQRLISVFQDHGVFAVSMVTADPDNLWNGLSTSPPNVVGFVGSTRTGVEVVRSAAQHAPLAPVQLELGGNDAVYISQKNTPVEQQHAVEAQVEGITWNAGQSCCAPQRVFVNSKVADTVQQLQHKALKNVHIELPSNDIKYSDATKAQLRAVNTGKNEEVTMSGMAMAKHGDELRHIISSEHSRDTVIGTLGAGKGSVFSPGVLWAPEEPAVPTHGLWSREAFGPVLVAKTVDSLESALTAANSSNYGLTSCIYSHDTHEVQRWIAGSEAGTVMANRCDYVDPSGVWAGWKQSGRGEMGGFSSFFNLTKAKTVHAKWLQ